MTWYTDSDFSWLETKEAADSVPAADVNDLNGNNLKTWENMKALLGSDAEPSTTFSGIVATVADIDARVSLHDPILMRSIVSNNSSDADHDIDIAAGWEIDSTGTYRMGGDAMTKRMDAAWDEGTNAGGLFDGSLAASTWYCLYKIRNDNDGSIDYGADTYANGVANLPSGYSVYRRIAYFITDGSANIIPFFQEGNHFFYYNDILDLSVGPSDTNAHLATVSIPPDMIGIFTAYMSRASSSWAQIRISSPYEQDVSAVFGNSNMRASNSYNHCMYRQYIRQVNTSSQIRWRCDATSDTALIIYSEGWIDTRI